MCYLSISSCGKSTLNRSTLSTNILNTSTFNTSTSGISIFNTSILGTNGCKKLKKLLEQINIFDIFTNTNADTELSQYIISRQEEIARSLLEDVFMIITPKKFVILDETVTSEEISISTKVFNFCFVNEIKNLDTYKAYEKRHLVFIS